MVLIRHAESEANQRLHETGVKVTDQELLKYTDPTLTEKGRAQAAAVGAHLVKEVGESKDTVKLYYSPQKRARQTKQIIFDSLKQSRATIFASMMPNIYEYRCPEKGPLFVELGGDLVEKPCDENPGEFIKRVNSFVCWCESQVPNTPSKTDKIDTIFVVGHSLFFSAMTAICSSQRAYEPCLEGLAFHLPNCSLTVLQYDGVMWSVLKTGDDSCLPRNLRTGGHTTI